MNTIQKDLLLSFSLSILWFLLTILTLFDDYPNYFVPFESKTTEKTSRSPITLTTREVKSIQWFYVSLILKILLGLIVLYVIYMLYKHGLKSPFQKKTKEKPRKTLKQKIVNLNTAREQARKTLLHGLEINEYTNTIVKAYHQLDQGLQDFRKVARLKHVTPKEYAYSVYEPVYQSSVRGIVEIFYRIQYGMQDGSKQQVLDFLYFLDHIFMNDVTDTAVSQKIQSLMESYVTDYTEMFIPRVFDFTKPFRRQQHDKEEK